MAGEAAKLARWGARWQRQLRAGQSYKRSGVLACAKATWSRAANLGEKRPRAQTGKMMGELAFAPRCNSNGRPTQTIYFFDI